ncbi:MAG: uncharacterized protein PWQ20_104 [Thermotogaceae bacterium]|jgi:hypothetical protein|nr:uncharacterized protein [Thermotogaceae bacterium]MDN5337034.1 uncharacterized protein [Thermotogaceae bacterium]
MEGFENKEKIKSIVKKVHENPDTLNEAKEEFKKLIRELTPLQVAQIEQEMIREGVPAETIHLMCDVHLEIFKEALAQEELDVPHWHPISILVEEHKDILNRVKEVKNFIDKITETKIDNEQLEKLLDFLNYLKSVNLYFLKEENVLFPYLEKHGVVQPPAIMWKEHDHFRELSKKFENALKQNNSESMKSLILTISELITNHVFKEHKILFPTALKLIEDDEWKMIRKEFDEIGYFAYFPIPFEFTGEEKEDIVGNILNLRSGYLSLEQLIKMLNHLPVDITFVDENDLVKYFNESKERIFVRTRAVIGRKVQNCHPPKSVHVVNRILEDFKSGVRDHADFWLKLGDKYVYIIYIAVRDEDGRYLGALEVTQDILKFKNLEGEKRIYDNL